jgi:hypothetical protein
MRKPVISVVGDAAVRAGHPVYDHAFDVGRLAVDAGFRVMTGGLRGVMEAASKGAHASSRYASGDTIGILPRFDPSAANEWVDVAIATGLEHGRNALVANADAVVAIGGGAGTLSEIAFAWMYKRLVVTIRGHGWADRLGGVRLDHRPRGAGGEDPVFAVSDAAEAIALIRAKVGEYALRGEGFRGS